MAVAGQLDGAVDELQRGRAVRDEQERLALERGAQRGEEAALGLGVERRRELAERATGHSHLGFAHRMADSAWLSWPYVTY